MGESVKTGDRSISMENSKRALLKNDKILTIKYFLIHRSAITLTFSNFLFHFSPFSP
ncbi:hypothetical protein QF044_003883 [Chryseobacterium sp. W4I1]|nr:hypothetical protein [Chryseobacterium sp. W4I1]